MSQEQPVEISQSEFKEWTENAVTKLVVKQVIEKRDDISNYIASGNTIHKDAEYTTDFMVGQIRGISELFAMFSDVKEEAKSEHSYEH